MTSMTRSTGPLPESTEETPRLPHEQVHPGSKAGLWLLVGTMGVLAFGILRDLMAALFR